MNKINNLKTNFIEKIKKSLLLKNTIILLIASIIIKILSLLNRIIMTRMIASNGISLYIITLPTIMLFTSIGGFSLNVSIAKEISINNNNSKYILRKGLLIALITSTTSSLILFLLSPTLSKYALKQPIVIPILYFSIPFIIITSFNNVYKGIIHGFNKMNDIAITSLIEQISRFIIMIILLIIFKSHHSIFLVSLVIISMIIGELLSLLYNIYKTKKLLLDIELTTNKNVFSNICKLSFNTTLTHLSYNITSFLEPIIYTFCLSYLSISSETILFKYSEINAYTIPTLSLVSFVSFQISQALLPVFSSNYRNKNINYIEKTVSIIIFYLFAFGIFLSNVFYYYGENILYLLYNSTIGLHSLKLMTFIFIFSYINPIIIVLLQSIGEDKFILKSNIILSIFKLVLLFILSIISITSNYSLIISIVINLLLSSFIMFFKVNKIIKIKIPVLKLVFLFLFIFNLFFIIKLLNLNFIITILINLIISIIVILFLK